MHTVHRCFLRLMTIVGKSRHMTLPRGNFNELQMADLAVQNERQAITWETKRSSEIRQLKTAKIWLVSSFCCTHVVS